VVRNYHVKFAIARVWCLFEWRNGVIGALRLWRVCIVLLPKSDR